MLFASHEAGFSAWCEYWLEECSLAAAEKARGLIEMSKSCGWWAPYRGAAIFQHRHSELHRDDRGRLHNERGMAVRYRDGWGVWAINGVRVPERVVMEPEKLTVAEIRGEKNAEIRRIMRERYGDGRYLADIGAKVIDVDTIASDKLARVGGTIIRALLEDDEKNRWLVGSDGSTRRVYHMRVPNDARTCRDAHAALMVGKQPERIVLEV